MNSISTMVIKGAELGIYCAFPIQIIFQSIHIALTDVGKSQFTDHFQLISECRCMIEYKSIYFTVPNEIIDSDYGHYQMLKL